MTKQKKVAKHEWEWTEIHGNGECPECGVDIPANEINLPCPECGTPAPQQY